MSAAQPQSGVGVSNTASTVQGESVVRKAKKDPAWKYCTRTDANKTNSLRCNFCDNVYTNGITRIKFHLAHIPTSGCNLCEKFPVDVRDEILQYLLKKGDKKASKINEQKRKRSEVNVSHSEGEFLDAKQEITAKFEHEETSFQEVLDIVDKRWDSKLKRPLHRAGYFLNPYYYYQNRLATELDGQFQAGLVICMEKMVVDGVTQDKILDEIKEYQNEEGSFGRESAKRQRRNKSFDPAKWWSIHGTSAPNLRILAMRILSLTCSSSPCERNFSVFQQIHTKRRSRLLSNKLRDLVFIKFNSKLTQKREMRDYDPLEDTTYADVVEDEENEWITGVVPVPVVPIEVEDDEPEETSQGHRVSHPRKRMLPVLANDDGQSGGSSSSSKDDANDSD